MTGSAPSPGIDKQGRVLHLPLNYSSMYGKDLVNALGKPKGLASASRVAPLGELRRCRLHVAVGAIRPIRAD